MSRFRTTVSEIVDQLRTNEDLRVGIVDEKLYIWKSDPSKDDMLNAWRNVYFYFDIREISKMVDEIGTQLKLGKSKYERAQNLNELLKQMTNSSDAIKIDDSRSRIVGETLHFIRDVLGLHTKDLEGIVTKVAGWNGVGGISNPRFPEGKELEIERTRLYAILKSDGWVNRYRTVGYAERNSDRFDMVEKGLKAWGDIKLTRYYDNAKRAYETRFPSPFWEALNFWGFPLGDKMMRNEELGLDVNKLCLEAVKVYLGELIPEDGSFSSDSGFTWSRSVVLKPGKKKGDEYGFKSLITTEQASFVKEHGYHDTEKQRKVLTISRLQELARNPNPNIFATAKDLERIVQSNPSRLAEDEIKLPHRLGIDAHSAPMVIRYSLRTGRVSAYWKIKLTNKVDNEKWAIVCPPNDIRKRNSVKTWLKKRESTLDKAKQELGERGISYDEWWI